MIRQRDYIRAKANKTGSSVLRQAYSQVRAKVNQKLYELRKSYFTSKIEQHKYDLKIHGKYLKVPLEKLIRPYKLKRLILKVKNLLIKSKLQNFAKGNFVSIGDKLTKNIQPGNEHSLSAHIQPATKNVLRT